MAAIAARTLFVAHLNKGEDGASNGSRRRIQILSWGFKVATLVGSEVVRRRAKAIVIKSLYRPRPLALLIFTLNTLHSQPLQPQSIHTPRETPQTMSDPSSEMQINVKGDDPADPEALE